MNKLVYVSILVDYELYVTLINILLIKFTKTSLLKALFIVILMLYSVFVCYVFVTIKHYKIQLSRGVQMTYKQLKWLILLIPTITVGLWEYVRHEYLLPYISMDLGNWLTPVIVLLVTFTLLTRFFTKMEVIQEQLRKERAEKAALKERERIAQGLHDGIAQSLFLLSVKVNQLKKIDVAEEDKATINELNEKISEIHQYIRSSIENLREPQQEDLPWLNVLYNHIARFENEANITIDKTIDVDETLLSSEEKVELASCIQEALINIHKHAHASNVMMEVIVKNDRLFVSIKDDGIGFNPKIAYDNHYGIKMMHERCNKINWQVNIKRTDDFTTLCFTPK